MVCDTDMRDFDILSETLAELGVPKDAIEVHSQPVPLNGYPGDRTKSAHVVIRAGTAAGAPVSPNALSDSPWSSPRTGYDIGFEKQSDGTYRAYVNDMDRHRGLARDIVDGRMKRLYAKNMTIRTVARQGWRVQSCEEDGGKIKLKVLPR